VCGGELCNPVYQRNDIIDPNRLDSMGRTNIERMKQGVSAIGPDGKSINLHHIYQVCVVAAWCRDSPVILCVCRHLMDPLLS
jgi:hypothetical protein